MNHIVIGCNEFNYVISFFIMKQSHILQTGKVLFGVTALSWSLARKAQLRMDRPCFSFSPSVFYLSFTVWIYPGRDHNHTCVLNRGNLTFTACGCWWRVNHSTSSSVDVVEPRPESISCLEEAEWGWPCNTTRITLLSLPQGPAPSLHCWPETGGGF